MLAETRLSSDVNSMVVESVMITILTFRSCSFDCNPDMSGDTDTKPDIQSTPIINNLLATFFGWPVCKII
jgi:hypothetical protein